MALRRKAKEEGNGATGREAHHPRGRAGPPRHAARTEPGLVREPRLRAVPPRHRRRSASPAPGRTRPRSSGCWPARSPSASSSGTTRVTSARSAPRAPALDASTAVLLAMFAGILAANLLADGLAGAVLPLYVAALGIVALGLVLHDAIEVAAGLNAALWATAVAAVESRRARAVEQPRHRRDPRLRRDRRPAMGVTHPAQRLDDTVHQRVRLGILAVLSEASRADFGFLRDTLEPDRRQPLAAHRRARAGRARRGREGLRGQAARAPGCRRRRPAGPRCATSSPRCASCWRAWTPEVRPARWAGGRPGIPWEDAARRLHAAGARVVRAGLRGADPGAVAGVAGDRHRRAHADLRADRLGQDARRLPLGARPARRRADDRPHAARLRLAAQGALVRRGEEPARAAARDRRRRPGRHPHRRHAAEGAARHDPAPAGHPDHDARVALPDAHEPGAGDLRRRRAGDRGRDPRRGADQARRPPRAHARAARRGGRATTSSGSGSRATQNPLEEVGRFLVGPQRTCTIVDTGTRKPLDLKIHVPVESMVEPEQKDARPRPVRRRRGDAQVDLARDLPRAAQGGPGAPLDDRLRQQPPRRRAARAAAQRARRGADRPRAPRLARARGAARRRGAAQGRRAAVPRGHLVARARHRHGRRRPRPPGRVAEVGHGRAAADRPLRPRRRRHRQGPDLPQVPRRPARVRGRRASACARA